jgi:hypothetical protein
MLRAARVLRGLFTSQQLKLRRGAFHRLGRTFLSDASATQGTHYFLTTDDFCHDESSGNLSQSVAWQEQPRKMSMGAWALPLFFNFLLTIAGHDDHVGALASLPGGKFVYQSLTIMSSLTVILWPSCRSSFVTIPNGITRMLMCTGSKMDGSIMTGAATWFQVCRFVSPSVSMCNARSSLSCLQQRSGTCWLHAVAVLQHLLVVKGSGKADHKKVLTLALLQSHLSF